MKITRTHVQPYSLPWARPVRSSAGLFTHREGLWLWLEGQGGAVGAGEAAPWPGFGALAQGATLAQILADAQVACAALREGRAAAQILAEQRFPELRFALESALASLEAASQGVSMAQHLAQGAVRGSVPVHALVEDARQAAQAVARGFGALKVKVGALSLEEDEARLWSIRDQVGAAVALRVDVNGAWTLEQARRALDAWADLALDWVEQPVQGQGWAQMGQLCARSAVPVALDESITDAEALERALAHEAADVVVLKPMFLGLERAAMLAQRARSAGSRVILTHALESSVGRMATLQLAAALPWMKDACGLAGQGPDAWTMPEPVDGRMAVPQRPGLGLEVAPW